MQEKNQNFSMDALMRLAKSPAGQQLMAMLNNQDSQKVEQAAAQAKNGDYAKAGQTLRDMLSSPEAQRLMKELGGK